LLTPWNQTRYFIQKYSTHLFQSQTSEKEAENQSCILTNVSIKIKVHLTLNNSILAGGGEARESENLNLTNYEHQIDL
jgi:hypothetical protein